MKKSADKVPQYTKRFQHSVERLLNEVHESRQDFAVISASDSFTLSDQYQRVAARALQSDLLIRLIRVFEYSGAASFWYLHRRASTKVSKGIDIKWLKDFSDRLKEIRDKSFVHIDKHAVFDPEKVYQDANIEWTEIRKAIETTWMVLTRLYVEEKGDKLLPPFQKSLDGLIEDFKRYFLTGVKSSS